MLCLLGAGKKQPSSLGPYLEPLVDELLELHAGVPAFDAFQKEEFTLQAHLVLNVLDIPATAKVLLVKGQGAYSACFRCQLQG